MQQRVLSYCQRNGLFAPGEKILVAVSGGADSVALLSVLHGLRERLGISLVGVHLNHGFRGAESDADAEFVASLCRRLSIPCHIRVIDVPSLLASSGGSAQEVSREERLAFYRTVATEEGAAAVALGHHRDDQAETVLLHLLRGSGARGMAGMSPMTVLGGLRLVRPLLEESRTDIEAYLQEAGLSFRTDSSNATNYYARNLLRNEAMPLLKNINPGIVEAVARTAELLRDEDALLDELTETLWSECTSRQDDRVILQIDALSRVHVALQRRLVRRAWLAVSGGSSDLDAVHVADVLGLTRRQRGRMIELPQGILALRERNGIALTRLNLTAASYLASLALPGELLLPGGMLLRATESAEGSCSGQWCVCGSFAENRLTVRNRLPGDRYQPSGFAGRRKLQDVVSEAEVPRPLRPGWPVLLAGDTIVWTPGGRIAQGFAPEEGDRIFTLSLFLGGYSDD